MYWDWCWFVSPGSKQTMLTVISVLLYLYLQFWNIQICLMPGNTREFNQQFIYIHAYGALRKRLYFHDYPYSVTRCVFAQKQQQVICAPSLLECAGFTPLVLQWYIEIHLYVSRIHSTHRPRLLLQRPSSATFEGDVINDALVVLNNIFVQ